MVDFIEVCAFAVKTFVRSLFKRNFVNSNFISEKMTTFDDWEVDFFLFWVLERRNENVLDIYYV